VAERERIKEQRRLEAANEKVEEAEVRNRYLFHMGLNTEQATVNHPSGERS
jgi:hypothetical protein